MAKSEMAKIEDRESLKIAKIWNLGTRVPGLSEQKAQSQGLTGLLHPHDKNRSTGDAV